MAGSWQHIALSYDKTSGQAAIYLNGSVVVQTNLGVFTPQTSFTNFLIGARTTFGSALSPNDKFSGEMDEMSVYSRALASNEIQAIYNAGSAGKCTTTNCTPVPVGLVGWWQGEGNTLDQIGGNSGTLVGNTTYASAKVGQGFVFDGNADAVRVGNPTNLQFQDLTIEAWVKRTSSSSASLSAFIGFIFAYGAGGYAFGVENDGTLMLTKTGAKSGFRGSHALFCTGNFGCVSTDEMVHHLVWVEF